jgi:hypothetical protein
MQVGERCCDEVEAFGFHVFDAGRAVLRRKGADYTGRRSAPSAGVWRRYNRRMPETPLPASSNAAALSTAPAQIASTEAEVVEFVIVGMTQDGGQFRPSDWAERLCGVMAAFGGDHRMQYSPYVHPVTSDGVRCVVVDHRLEELEPMAYRFLLSFAKDNALRVRPGRVASRTLLEQLTALRPSP